MGSLYFYNCANQNVHTVFWHKARCSNNDKFLSVFEPETWNLKFFEINAVGNNFNRTYRSFLPGPISQKSADRLNVISSLENALPDFAETAHPAMDMLDRIAFLKSQ